MNVYSRCEAVKCCSTLLNNNEVGTQGNLQIHFVCRLRWEAVARECEYKNATCIFNFMSKILFV